MCTTSGAKWKYVGKVWTSVLKDTDCIWRRVSPPLSEWIGEVPVPAVRHKVAKALRQSVSPLVVSDFRFANPCVSGPSISCVMDARIFYLPFPLFWVIYPPEVGGACGAHLRREIVQCVRWRLFAAEAQHWVRIRRSSFGIRRTRADWPKRHSANVS